MRHFDLIISTATSDTTFPAVTPSPLLHSSGLTLAHQRMLQIVATVSSLITLLATVVTVYMFHRMSKRMRHKRVDLESAETLQLG
ncbi:hypothetical protein Vi05172_g9476 [Venturia inaequalis]|nr:hypothetical protein Vi05172_g9476 [Venturia inaequalis]